MDPFTALSLAAVIVQFVDFGIKLTVKSSEMYNSINGQAQADVIIFQDTNRLGEFSKQLTQSLSNRHSTAEVNIASLARECASEAERLRAILYELQGLTLGEKVRVILDGLDQKTDTEKLNTLRDKVKGRADKEKLDAILQELTGATDGEKLKVILARFPPPSARKLSSTLVAALKSLWKKKEVQEIHDNLKEYRAQLTLCMAGLINDKHSSITALLEKLVESSSLANDERSNQMIKLQDTLDQVRGLISQASKPDSNPDVTLNPLPQKLDCLMRLGDDAIKTVVGGLKFESMRIREGTVSPAHKKTFEWLFTDESPFYSWLSTSNGIFWVSGKPGSGKSTLMKFVSQHKECKTALQSWAGDDLLITASFFFWNPGTPMQRSLQGLLQTVLYQIMKSCPLLIPIITPDRWANALGRAVEYQDPWPWEEITAALHRFISQKKISCATCLFIDGLDEFDGDHSEMVKLLSIVSESSNIKVCLASRPYNVFVDAYGQTPHQMIRLQDLTREDIRQYVLDNLQTHSSIARTSTYNDQYRVFVEDIVNRAEGVFLWVYLVIRSLKDGLTNADTVSKLQQRLQKLPSGLSEYFSYILRSVDDIYWEDTAKVFQMLVSSQHPLPPGVLSVLDEDDPDYCVEVGIQLIPLEEYEENIQIIERRLSARCKGLIEIRKTPGSIWGSKDYIDRYFVNFLHRSVRDFLRNEDVSNLLKARLTASFDADLTLCRGFLLHIKRFIIADDPSVSKELSFNKALEDLIYFAQRSEMILEVPLSQILDEALRAIGVVGKITKNVTESTFYTRILRHGLSRYLEYRLQINPRIPQRANSVPPLAVALISTSTQSEGNRYDCALRPSVIQTLLKYGADPNASAGVASRGTVWTFFVAYTLSSGAEYVKQDPDVFFDTFAILLSAGAERYGNLTHHIQRVFSTQKARQLEQLVKDLDSGKQTPTIHDLGVTVAFNAQITAVSNNINIEPLGESSNFAAKKTHIHELRLSTKGDDQANGPAQERHKLRSLLGSMLPACFRS